MNKEFKAVDYTIEQEKAQNNASVAIKRKAQQGLERSMNSQMAQLKKKTAGRADMQKQVNDLEKRMKEAQNAPSASTMQKQMELQQLKEQLNELQSTLASQ